MILRGLVSRSNKLLFYRNLHLPKVEIPPRLPVHNDFLLDTRTRGERKVINPEWKPKTGGNSLKIEMIDRKDFDLIGQFFNYNFLKHANIFRHLDMRYSELQDIMFQLLATFIDKPISYAVFDENKLVAIKLNNYHTEDEFPDMFGKNMPGEVNPKFEMKKDYGEDVKNGPYNHNGNLVFTLLKEGITNTGKFLPKDSKKLGFLEATAIHPKYMGCGLIQYLYALSIKTFAEHECDHFTSYCIATATYKIGTRIGMKQIFEMPYRDFVVDGKVVFDKEMYDGAPALRVLLGNVKDSYKIISKDLK